MESFPVLSAKELRSLDERAESEFGISTEFLMENAGKAVAKETLKILNSIPKIRQLLIFCGGGNNAGDGFVAARLLHEKKIPVKLILLKAETVFKNAALSNFRKIKSADIPAIVLPSKEEIQSQIRQSSLIIDAIFGTGFKGNVEGIFFDAIDLMNRSLKPVVAVDIPSGLDADKGDAGNIAVRAHTTVTFAALKKGFMNESSNQYTGKVIVVDIGFPEALFLNRK